MTKLIIAFRYFADTPKSDNELNKPSISGQVGKLRRLRYNITAKQRIGQ
jgi:hypothetical protein